MTKDMTEGNPLLLILKFALPLLAGNLLQQGYNVADAAIVGRFLGTDALAGVGASSSVQFLILGFCIGTCTGFCVPVAQRFGGRRLQRHAPFCFQQFYSDSDSGGSADHSVRAVLYTDRRASCYTAGYFCRCLYLSAGDFAGIPFTLLYNLTSSIMRAVGDSRTPFLFLAFACVANIFLDIFCITTLKWGVAGAAIATITSQLMSGVLCLIYMMKKYPVLKMEKEELEMRGDFMRTLVIMDFPWDCSFLSRPSEAWSCRQPPTIWEAFTFPPIRRHPVSNPLPCVRLTPSRRLYPRSAARITEQRR